MKDFRIKKLSEDDWEILRDIRLDALKKHPDFFCPARNEFKFSRMDWMERLNNPNGASFALFLSDEVIGLTGIVKEGNQSDTDIAQMVASYIKEKFRRRGLTKLFYECASSGSWIC